MVRQARLSLCLAFAALGLLYLYHLGALGMVGPDEPRYAAIGRAMATTGDWITPRLWGQPWFEKPAALYLMIAAGFRLGLSSEWAPRLPIALLSVVFLAGYYWQLCRVLGKAEAWCSTLLLSTCAGWLAFSQVAVTDLPLAVFTSAALLLVLDVPGRVPSVHRLCVIAALLGAAVLAKGLVPLVLALPAAWTLRHHWRRLLHPAPLACFLAIALPWYLLCWARNGNTFLEVFFVQHQFGRFTSDALQHVRPFWFYAPVLLGGVFPWVLLLPTLLQRSLWSDARMRYLLAWFGFGFLFFSLSRNKLPGYLLPLLPALMAMLGVSIVRARRAAPLLALTCLLLMAIPVAMFVLPAALNQGTPFLPIPEAAALRAALLLPVAFLFAAVVYFADRNGAGRVMSVTVVALAICLLVAAVKHFTLPSLDRALTARPLWQSLAHDPAVCCGPIHRAWRYGLNYYSGVPLPDCALSPAAVRVEPGQPRPVIIRMPTVN